MAGDGILAVRQPRAISKLEYQAFRCRLKLVNHCLFVEFCRTSHLSASFKGLPYAKGGKFNF